jgi:hypothetical protein
MKFGLTSDQPEPWLSDTSDASPELRAFLREANVHPEDALRIERLRQRLGPWLAVTPTPPSAPPATTTAASGSATPGTGFFVGSAVGKACLVAVGAGTIAAATWAGSQRSQPPPLSPYVPPVVTTTTHMPNRAAPPQATATAAKPSAPAKPAVATASAPVPLIASPRRPKAVEPSSLAKEAAELSGAQRMLASSPQLALSMLKQHAAKYPNGALVEERRLFTIQALALVGRREEAKRELEGLRQSFPRSPHLARAQRLVEIAPAPR